MKRRVAYVGVLVAAFAAGFVGAWKLSGFAADLEVAFDIVHEGSE